MKNKGKVYLQLVTQDPNITKEDFQAIIRLPPTRFRAMKSQGGIPLVTSWNFGTDYVEDVIVKDEVETIIQQLVQHQQEFEQLLFTYPSVKCRFVVVLYHSWQGGTPVLCFPPATLQFLAALNAAIDCDLYPP